MATPAPTTPPGVTIRRATPADAAPLATFAAAAFADTYGGASHPADVAAYVGAHFGDAMQRAELADAATTVLLALDATGALTGYAHLRAGPPPAALPPVCASGTVLEIARFYVARAWHGRGVAQALFDAVLAEPGAAAGLWLTVYQENPRAIAFYHRQGFDIAGTGEFWLGAERQDDYVMTRHPSGASTFFHSTDR